MTLYFTEEEMISFIRGKGYEVTEVEAWRDHNSYHGMTKDELVKIEIAYWNVAGKGKIPEFRKNPTEFDVMSKYGIKTIFEKLMHKALLNL